MWPRRITPKRADIDRTVPVTNEDRALIAQALAAGRVTLCPPAMVPTATVLGVKVRAPEPEEIAELLRAERSA